MKDLWIVIGIIFFIFIGNSLLKNYFEKSGHKVIQQMEELSDGIEIDSDTKKQEKIENLKQVWDDSQKYWIMFYYHETINNMEDVFLECCNHYLSANKEEFQVALDKLKRAINDLKNREEISILNIL